MDEQANRRHLIITPSPSTAQIWIHSVCMVLALLRYIIMVLKLPTSLPIISGYRFRIQEEPDLTFEAINLGNKPPISQ
jgi:hypothetical protein